MLITKLRICLTIAQPVIAGEPRLIFPVATAPGTDLYMIAAAGQLNRSALSVQNPDASE